MARPQRIEYEGAVYHVTARGNERHAIFRDDADREHFLHVLRESIGRFDVRLYLFCLMGNHVHLVVETPRANLGRFMHRLQTAYTIYFNLRHNRNGHLLQGRYGARLVEKDAYILRLSRYVHLNPVFTVAAKALSLRERIAALRAYPWSSYRSYIGAGRSLDYVERSPILAMIEQNPSKRPIAYRRFVESGIDEVDVAFLQAQRVSPLCVGTDEFCEKVRTLYRQLCHDKSHQEDIAFRRIGKRLDAAVVLKVVCKRLGIEQGSLLRAARDSRPRAIASKMLCDMGGLTQREVAKVLGLRSSAAVSKQLHALTQQLAADRDLQQAVTAISSELHDH